MNVDGLEFYVEYDYDKSTLYFVEDPSNFGKKEVSLKDIKSEIKIDKGENSIWFNEITVKKNT